MRPTAGSILLATLHDLRRTWPQLVLADLLARVLAIVVLTPALGLLLKVFLASTATGVVADFAIISFLLHPAGLAALLVVGAVSLGVTFAETGGLMVIGFGATEERRVTWLAAFEYAWLRVVPLVRLGAEALVRLLAIAIPFLAALGALCWFLLRTYDINYYLVQKPPEFWAAVLAAGLILIVTAIAVVLKIAGWLLALPLVLFEAKGGPQALRASEAATKEHRLRLAVWLVGWIVAVGLVSALLTYLVGRLGGLLIPRDGSNLTLLLAGLSGVLVVSGLANLALAVFTTVLFPLLLVRLYRSLAGPGELRPRLADPGSLDERPSLSVPGKKVLWAGAAALLATAMGGYLALSDLGAANRAEIIAHRGASAAAPENTMAAFERAIADGADWLELDVQENADGVVVVQHDRDFMRAAGVRLEVWNATNADLADLDVGSLFSPEFSDQRTPTLRQVLELAKGRVGVFIELKYYGHDRDLEAGVVDVVETVGMESDIVVMSLEYDGVRKMAALRPVWTCGLLNVVSLGDLTRLDVDFLALSAGAASYAMIRHAQRRGMKVYAWTINDPVQMWVMMSRGVDGIITDRVALARQVQDLRAKLTPLGRIVIWLAGEAGLLTGVERSSAREDA